jgi:hypothetical protein
VPPADNVNLVAAVSKVLAAARRAKTLEAHLRVLAKLQKQLLMQLHSQREEAACATRSWQVCLARGVHVRPGVLSCCRLCLLAAPCGANVIPRHLSLAAPACCWYQRGLLLRVVSMSNAGA